MLWIHIKTRGFKNCDAVLDYMPSPVDIPAIKGVDEDGNEIERIASDEEPFSNFSI